MKICLLLSNYINIDDQATYFGLTFGPFIGQTGPMGDSVGWGSGMIFWLTILPLGGTWVVVGLWEGGWAGWFEEGEEGNKEDLEGWGRV